MLRIHFIGSGHLARSLIAGLCDNTSYRLSASSPSIEQKPLFESISTHTDNTALLADAQMIVLAVKPDQINQVCKEITHVVTKQQLIISLAAGIKKAMIGAEFKKTQPIVRAMPNIAAEYHQSATALFEDNLTDIQRAQVETLFKVLGSPVWVSSDHEMDIATALAGSSPAFLYQFMDALITSATQAGLAEDTAKILGSQAMLGALEVSRQSKQDYGALSKQVESKKGTTEAGLSHLKSHGMREIVQGALMAAIERAQALAQEADKD